jgi:hypothetical protein
MPPAPGSDAVPPFLRRKQPAMRVLPPELNRHRFPVRPTGPRALEMKP